MSGFPALQQFLPDRFVVGIAAPEERSCHCQRLFRVIRRLTDAPLIPLASVTGNDVSRAAMESRDAFGIPLDNVRPGQRFGLLANRVAGCQPLKAGNYPFLNPHKPDPASLNY
jgi:hypothetical protein